jgi:hypothetical protein
LPYFMARKNIEEGTERKEKSKEMREERQEKL